MKFFYCLLFISLTILTGCRTNPPSTTEAPPAVYGKVFVSSSIDSAYIFLDNVNTGRFTPDTITAAVGSHTVRVEKTGYISYSVVISVNENALSTVNAVMQQMNAQKVVLLEDFANVSCIPCVVSNKIIESLSNIYFGRSKVAVVKFATNWPSPNDPFYLANTSEAQARWGSGFYDLITAPTIIVDGILKPTPSDSNDVKSKIISRLNTPAKFSVDVKDSLAGDSYFIKVDIIVYDTSALKIQNLVLHTVVTETNIEFATPPGSNGETKFYNVMRKMLPGSSGETLGNIKPGTALHFERQMILNTSWLKPHIYTVAFIQDMHTKEVYQAGSTF